MKLRRVLVVCAGLWLTASAIPAQTVPSTQSPIKIIFDTDFAMPPQDDSMALILALKSPELKILGITTVAGNDTVQRATADALRVLEIGGRTDIPVFQGANRPWVHQKSEWATTIHGKWWSSEPPPTPPGGFAKKKAEKESAIDFMTRTVDAEPGQVTIVALGPLTNVATAIRMDPQFAHNVKKIAIMGGAFATLPDGGGNTTPNAEFNIWVDPEAARTVLHSGIPLEFTPLNVTSKTSFTKEAFDEIVGAHTALTNLIDERMGAIYDKKPDMRAQMYDQLTVASLIDHTLVKTTTLYVEIDIDHGPDYGTTLGGKRPWEGGEQAVPVSIQYDVDDARFIRMFVDRVKR